MIAESLDSGSCEVSSLERTGFAARRRLARHVMSAERRCRRAGRVAPARSMWSIQFGRKQSRRPLRRSKPRAFDLSVGDGARKIRKTASAREKGFPTAPVSLSRWGTSRSARRRYRRRARKLWAALLLKTASGGVWTERVKKPLTREGDMESLCRCRAAERRLWVLEARSTFAAELQHASFRAVAEAAPALRFPVFEKTAIASHPRLPHCAGTRATHIAALPVAARATLAENVAGRAACSRRSCSSTPREALRQRLAPRPAPKLRARHETGLHASQFDAIARVLPARACFSPRSSRPGSLLHDNLLGEGLGSRQADEELDPPAWSRNPHVLRRVSLRKERRAQAKQDGATPSAGARDAAAGRARGREQLPRRA